jgi:4-amino-4-deoxy-L-arabinose transferase-like glycosyltransferase
MTITETKLRLAKIPELLERYATQIATTASILVLLGGIFYSLSQGEYLRYPDERDYATLANNLVRYKAYTLDGASHTAYRPPGYPLILSVMAAANLSTTHMRMLNFVLLSCSILMLYSILKNLHSKLSGGIAAVLVLGYPVLFYAAGMLVPQTLEAFLLLLAMKLILARRRPVLLRYSLAGGVLGLQVLAIPSSIFLLGIFPLWFLWRSRSFSAFGYSLALLFGAGVIVAPWTIRNYQVFGKLVLVSTNSGANLLLGNNENTTPEGGATIRMDRYWQMLKGLNEAQQDSLLSAKAIQFITSNKIHSIKMYLLKFLNYFNFRNELGTREESNRLNDFIVLVTYGPLLILLLLRLALVRKFPIKSEELLFLVIYFGSALFFAIYFTRIRFRMPFDFLMIGIDAMFIVNLLESCGLVATLIPDPDKRNGHLTRQTI